MGNSTIIFKTIKDDNRKSKSIQAHINRLHIDYIATREGTDFSDNEHGLFGYIKGNNNVEEMKLTDITSHVRTVSNKNVDIIKTVISLREEDAIYKGLTNKEEWKYLIQDKIREIGNAYNIDFHNLEWVASFHAEKGHPHCHLVFWDLNQVKNEKKKPYVSYNKIKGTLAKGIFNVELDELYEIKNQTKKDITEDIKKFNKEYKEEQKIAMQVKEEMPNIYNNPVINFKFGKSTIEKINSNLEEIRLKHKNYKYQFQDPEVKELLDKTSKLILASSRECFNTFNKYIETELKIKEILYQANKEPNINRARAKAEAFMMSKIGNQILKYLKEEEFEKNELEYQMKRKEYLEKRKIKEQEYFEDELSYLEFRQRNNTCKLISDVYYLLNDEEISNGAKYSRIKQQYSSLSKQAKKEKWLEKRNSSGIEWFTL